MEALDQSFFEELEGTFMSLLSVVYVRSPVIGRHADLVFKTDVKHALERSTELNKMFDTTLRDLAGTLGIPYSQLKPCLLLSSGL